MWLSPSGCEQVAFAVGAVAVVVAVGVVVDAALETEGVEVDVAARFVDIAAVVIAAVVLAPVDAL